MSSRFSEIIKFMEFFGYIVVKESSCVCEFKKGDIEIKLEYDIRDGYLAYFKLVTFDDVWLPPSYRLEYYLEGNVDFTLNYQTGSEFKLSGKKILNHCLLFIETFLKKLISPNFSVTDFSNWETYENTEIARKLIRAKHK